MAVEEKLFVRKATGLVREIGFITAIIIVIANVVGLGWQKRVFQFTGLAPLPENEYIAGISPMTMAFILGGIAILLSVLAIAVLTAAMPRSGGGYVVISRIVGPFWGFTGAWLEFLSIAWSFGIIAVAVFEGIYLIMGPIAFGTGFTTPAGISRDVFLFSVGLLLVVAFTIVGVFGVKLTGMLLQVMFWIPAVLTFFVFGLLSQANSTTITSGLSTLFPGVSAQQYVDAATNATGTLPSTVVAIQDQAGAVGGYWGAVGTALIGAYFAYIGYAASTFVAGEVKEANRSIPKAVIIATLLIIALYIAVSSAAAGALKGIASVTVDGKEYSLLSAWSYMSHGGSIGAPSLDSVGLPDVGLWTTSVAGLVAAGIGLKDFNVLLVVFGVFWIANDIPPFILTASRILFAMSFDRVLPGPLANVNDRFHSPINAVIATGVVATLGLATESGVFDSGKSWNPGGNLVLQGTLGSVGGVGITDLADALFFTLFTLSLVILPLRVSKRQIFDTAPYKPGGKWGMVLLGAAGVVANLFIDYELLFAPAGDFNLGAPRTFDQLWGLWFVIILAVIGMVIYIVHRRRPGVNYATIFAQIPPE